MQLFHRLSKGDRERHRSNHRTNMVYKPNAKREKHCLLLYDFCPFCLFIDKSLQLTFNINVWSISIFRSTSFRNSMYPNIWRPPSSQEPRGCVELEESSLYRRGNWGPQRLGGSLKIIATVTSKANLQKWTSFFTPQDFALLSVLSFSQSVLQRTQVPGA